MTSQAHVIGRQVLDLEIEAVSDAFALQAELGDAFQTHVIPAMSVLLDRVVDPEVIVRLDRLEIDVGRLSRNQFSEIFPARVCEALETKLTASLAAASQETTKPLGGGESWTKQEHALNLWHYLMEHGYLPWWASPATTADIEARVVQVLASLVTLPDATVKMLRTNTVAVRRLALQGSETLLKRVLQLLDKALAAVSLPLIDAILGLLETHSIASLRTEFFRRSLWEAALAESLQPTGRATDTRLLSLLRRAIQTTVGEASVTFAELLSHIRAFLEPSAASSPPLVSIATQRTLAAVLRALAESEELSLDVNEQVEFEAMHRQDRGTMHETTDLKDGTGVGDGWQPQDLTSNGGGPKTEDTLATSIRLEQDIPHSRGDSMQDAHDKAGADTGHEVPESAGMPASASVLQQDDTRLGAAVTPGSASDSVPLAGDATGRSGVGPLCDGAEAASTGDVPQPDAMSRLVLDARDAVSISGGISLRDGAGAASKDEAPPPEDAPAFSSARQQEDTRLDAIDTPGSASDSVPLAGDATGRSGVGPLCDGAEAASTGDVPQPDAMSRLVLDARDAASISGGTPLRDGAGIASKDEAPQPEDAPAFSSARQQEDTRLDAIDTPGAASKRLSVAQDTAIASGNQQPHSEKEGATSKNASAPTPIQDEHFETISKRVRAAKTERQAVLSATRIRKGEALFVNNAGIVLLHPFLQMHFEKLGLVQETGFVDEGSRERAVHQLHYLTTGEEEPREYLLILAKIICGLAPETPIARMVPLDEYAKSEADNVLKAVIRHWGALKNTSPDGLRETFLRREGRLERKDDGWKLQVESRSFDLLLDRLPWPLSVIRLPWMAELIFVEWI